MTAMAMQRRKDGKRSAPREKATGKKRDNGEREKKRQRDTDRNREAEKEEDQDTQRRKAGRLLRGRGRAQDGLAPSPAGRHHRAPRTTGRTQRERSGGAGAGPGRCPRVPDGAGKGGAWRAARRGRKQRCRAGAGRRQEAGRGGGAGASGKTPQLPAPPEPGSGSRDTGPGIAEPDLGRPAGHLPARTPGTLSVAPPGLLPAAWGSGRRREGAGALPAVEGPPRSTPEPDAAPPWASVFPSVKGDKERSNT